MQYRAPRSPRETIDSFRLYGPAEGLAGLARRFDFMGVGPHQVIHSVFGRVPRTGEIAAAPPDAAAAFVAALESREFQAHIGRRVLAAYPEKRRLLLVHIPKCAGSDLTTSLLRSHAGLNWRTTDRSWFPPPEFQKYLRRLAEMLAYSDGILVHGHVKLSVFVNDRLVRFGDDLFTVVREPQERAVSKLNYMLTRFSRDPELSRPDTKGWMQYLDAAEVRRGVSERRWVALANRMAVVPALMQTDSICDFLGEGDAASALELCGRSDIEITDVARYERWLAERWGIIGSARQNASEKIISWDDLGQEQKRFLTACAEQDRILVDAVAARLAATGAISVRGSALG